MLTNCRGECAHLTITVSEIERDICEKNRYFIMSFCIRRPVRGGSRRNIANPFGMKKLEWWGYLTVKKIEDMYNRLGTIPACDGQTDRHLATVYTRYAYASRSKNQTCLLHLRKELLFESNHL